MAALRIVGDDLVPAEVSALLGCEPTKSHARGDVLGPRWGTRTASFGLWTLRTAETEPADIDAQVAEILSRLTGDKSVWAEIRSRYGLSLFCGWFMEDRNEGVFIEPATRAALGARGIALDVDLNRGDSDDDLVE